MNELVSSQLAQLAQSGALSGGLGSMLWQIGLFGKAVLLILLVFMASGIGLIFERLVYLKKAAQDSHGFLATFRTSQRFSDVHNVCERFSQSPLVGLFLAGSGELSYQIKAKGASRGVEAISRSLSRASSVEVAKLERGVAFLATTASVTPFIGLLGTVVGIMNAFWEIGLRQSAGLAVVAPGIAEALINTAAGLGAAIPAVIGYNFLVTRIKTIAAEMDDFSLEFISITERSLDE